MQQIMKPCAATALGLLMLAGCGPKQETAETTTIVTNAAPAAPTPTSIVVKMPPVIVKTAKPGTQPGTQPGTKPVPKPTAKKAPPKTSKLGPIPQNATKLIVEDIAIGTGTVATPGKMVLVHYTGTLTDGSKFDSSLDRGQPFPFTLGRREVILGWDQGVAGMKVGGKRRLIIPSDLAYGPDGRGSIPPNATLVFTVELLSVQ